MTHLLRPSPPRPGPHPPHTVLLAAGDFGHRVAAGISAGMRDGSGRATVVDVQAAPWSALWPAGDVYVLCSDRPRPRTADRVDAAAAVWRRPWFTVALDHPDLRVGPVVRPGTTACHACFEARRRQHAGARAEALAALETRYSDESAAGVGGFADHHVTAAAALARLVLAELLAGFTGEPTGEPTGEAAEGATWAGTVTTLGTVTADLRRHRVVASDRCERCQGPVAARDVDDLAPYRNLLCPVGAS